MNKNTISYPLSVIFFIVISIFFFLTGPTQTKFTKIGNIPINNEGQIEEYFEPAAQYGNFLGRTVIVPEIIESFAYVLGEEVGEKRIEVDISNQRVYGYNGGSKIFDFVVSTGKWAPTPKGTFTVQRKVRVQKMSGGSKANSTYYYLPNVPWIMFFGNNKIPWYRGYSFHGTYWHNNFGQPMSHGCVNMKTPEAEQLYNWAPAGTPVIIY